MATKLFQKRVDSDLLEHVSEIYEDLGTSVQEAFVLFLRKSEEVGGLPFELCKNSVNYDDNGEDITDEKLGKAILSLKDYSKRNAVQLDDSNLEKMLIDKEY